VPTCSTSGSGCARTRRTRWSSGPPRRSGRPPTRGRSRRRSPRERIASRIGVALLFVCIAVSTALDRSSEDVFVEGVSQGILVLGWVSLWLPAERVVAGTIPHFFNRRRFAEFAEIEVELRWY